ncbi:MAG: tRNA preQ1(34) S-adenosylmethionine ribosyltransferase-isomerase QueA [Planctomycetia bacterium]
MTNRDFDLLSSWQFDLPPELIASRPSPERDDARLMVIDRAVGRIIHSRIRDLPQWLRAGDLLVFNNTKVLPARLFGIRTATGGRWEGLYIEQTESGEWHLLCDTRGRLTAGETITVIPSQQWENSVGTLSTSIQGPRLTLRLTQRQQDGSWLATAEDRRPVREILEEFGSLPLPPYMGRKIADEQDRERYQTSFAAEPGAVAAPTAGLHFTDSLLQRCAERGILRTELTLHTGPGTFRPVTSERLSNHQMHEEWCRLPAESADVLRRVRGSGRVVAVGTTSVRTLESAALTDSEFPRAWEGRTALFIQPGFVFRSVNCLLTNFHLPGSTLIVLVAAFADFELIMEGYRQAIEQRYRFFSYGDAMLIL